MAATARFVASYSATSLAQLVPDWIEAAAVLASDGSMSYKASPTGADYRIFMDASGVLFSRLAPVSGDRLVTIVSGVLTAA